MPRRHIGPLLALLAVCIAVFAAIAQAQSPPSSTPPAATPTPTVTPSPEELEAQRKAEQRTRAREARHLRRAIKEYRALTWYWRDVMQKGHKAKPYFAHASKKIDRLKWVKKVWKKRAHRAKRQAHNPPMKWAWFCLYREEHQPGQGWATNTGNGYYGGLQMDRDFQKTYGARWYYAKGTANNWTKWEQIWAAVRAYFSGRGFGPWPNTRLECGI